MRARIFSFACLWLVMADHAAAARQDPEPPPSGIVVHLFGPGSVMSNVLPAAPAGAAPGPAAPAAPGQPAPASAADDPEPSLGDVLHQMFVTGDPNDPPHPSTGRIGRGLAN